eukprot:CAMPEP_0196737528 /NCGR_PEP_ID=MMETSP1091-20130531/15224_1 /TAXON_ID=302021 /ORGANISM="Rhodomonas sp., Strain CCMP768" /LENGTH=389 /DNA_ID=CAMNT_0042081383 /DNA_START=63 /DNA_END=1229 /DNA_ORIENTATION=-
MTHYSAFADARERKQVLVLAACLCGAAALALIATTSSLSSSELSPSTSTELIGTWSQPKGIGIDKEPYSAPANLWLYWGSSTNRRFTGSGEHVRHVFKMGNIAGGEWRDPRFLRSLKGGMFNKLSEKCCTTLLFPPMQWDFLVVNANKVIGQNIRAYVANGNSMVLTGGILSLEFINRYFYYQLEEADGNYDAGPFLRLPHFQGLSAEQHDVMEPAPKVLPQVGIEVTSVKKESLPSGASIMYTSPFNSAVFAIKFCMADNPMSEDAAPLPPIKVLPRDCAASAAAGRPCSCGFICYLGYDWRDPYPSRWDTALKQTVDACSMVPPENAGPELQRELQAEPTAQPEESERQMEADEEEKEEQMEAGPAPPPEPQAKPNEQQQEQDTVAP